MTAIAAIPILQVADVPRSLGFYSNSLGFEVSHAEDRFAIVHLGKVELHLTAADDETWRSRSSLAPIVSGAESFLAGTGSCRIQLDDLAAMHERATVAGILHPNGGLRTTAWGTAEFEVLDPDRNLITFFVRRGL